MKYLLTLLLVLILGCELISPEVEEADQKKKDEKVEAAEEDSTITLTSCDTFKIQKNTGELGYPIMFDPGVTGVVDTADQSLKVRYQMVNEGDEPIKIISAEMELRTFSGRLYDDELVPIEMTPFDLCIVEGESQEIMFHGYYLSDAHVREVIANVTVSDRLGNEALYRVFIRFNEDGSVQETKTKGPY